MKIVDVSEYSIYKLLLFEINANLTRGIGYTLAPHIYDDMGFSFLRN